MTDTERKALALVNEACKSDFKDLGITYRNNILDALLLAIEQHEAFRQEVSDEIAKLGCWPDTVDLGRFIIAKPDPLVEVCREIGLAPYRPDELRAAMKARGYEWRKIEGEG